MNQHLLVKIPERRTVQLGTPHRCVANLGNSRAKAGPMSGAQPMSEASALAEAIALGFTCDWRLDLDRSGAPGPAFRHFPYAAEWLRINQRLSR